MCVEMLMQAGQHLLIILNLPNLLHKHSQSLEDESLFIQGFPDHHEFDVFRFKWKVLTVPRWIVIKFGAHALLSFRINCNIIRIVKLCTYQSKFHLWRDEITYKVNNMMWNHAGRHHRPDARWDGCKLMHHVFVQVQNVQLQWFDDKMRNFFLLLVCKHLNGDLLSFNVEPPSASSYLVLWIMIKHEQN